MTRALNLARFAAVVSAIVFAFAFNLAAMYAQVVYVFIPATRVMGGAPADWSYTESTGIFHVLATTSGLFPALIGAGLVGCAILYRRTK